jgi:hypothetical protein
MIDVNNIIDENTIDGITLDEEIEDNTAEDFVSELLTKIAAKYQSPNTVKESDEDVEQLVDYMGLSSWREFMSQHSKEVKEYFQTLEAEKAVDNRIEKAKARHAAALKRLKDAQEQSDKINKMINNFKANLANQEMEIQATEGMEWDEDSCKRNKAAKVKYATLTAKIKQLMSTPKPNVASLKINEKIASGIVRYTTREVNEDRPFLLINSGDPKVDAKFSVAIMKESAWSIGGVRKSLLREEKRQERERFSGADYYGGGSRNSDNPVEDAGGNVYEKASDKIGKLVREEELCYEMYAASLAQYKLAEDAFIPSQRDEWFPELIALEEAIMQSLQNRAKYSEKMQAEERKAAQSLADFV